MKKHITILMFLLIALLKVEAQYVRGDTASHKPQPVQPYTFWSHTSLGGNFGLQFGNETFVGIAPLLNYHFTQSLVVGIGPIYQYYKYTDPQYGYVFSSSLYGGRIAALCYLPGRFSNIFFMGEYDILNIPYFNPLLLRDQRTTDAFPLVGLGYRQPVGDRIYFTLAALWDLSNNQNSPYVSPIIEAGCDVGL